MKYSRDPWEQLSVLHIWPKKVSLQVQELLGLIPTIGSGVVRHRAVYDFLGTLHLIMFGQLFCQITMDRFVTILMIHKDATIYYILREKQARVVNTSLKLKSKH